MPALDDRKRLAAERAPFDRIGGRIEWTEPDLGRRFRGGSDAIAADRDGFAQIILG
jgi:hypothetical protein